MWSHLAVTFNGSVLRFYINGTQVGILNRAGSLTATTNPVCLGAYNCIAFRVPGNLDETVVYNRALSASEVLGRFFTRRADSRKLVRRFDRRAAWR